MALIDVFLAARNIFMDDERHIKIGDFGMSRFENYAHKEGSVLPLRWTALGTICLITVTFLRDIRRKAFLFQIGCLELWCRYYFVGFGTEVLVLWELFSYGESPYGKTNILDIMAMLSAGKRLPKLENIPDWMWSLMEKCWDRCNLN